MTEQPIRLSLSKSRGPIPGGPVVFGDNVYDTTAWGSTCPGCGKVPAAGQDITKISGVWWHATCGAAYLRTADPDQAWLALAQQAERAPSKFNNTEIKAILRNLLRLVGTAATVPDTPDCRRVHGEKAIEQATPAAGQTQFADVVDGFYGSDLYAAVLQAEQRHPGELPVTIGIRAWGLLDDEQQGKYLPELLMAYVELVRIQRDEDREEGL